MNIALGIEYAGMAYAGWQRQRGPKTVQGELEQALSRVADRPISVYCAGRTDKGVHATYQVVNFHTDAPRTAEAFMCGANTHLPADIKVHFAQAMPDDFHARFSAIRRHYQYIIYQCPHDSALFHQKVTWVKQSLDASLMQQGAQAFIGEHDFSAFRASDCQANSPIRHIYALNIKQIGCLTTVDIQANAFLHHMVRNIMGVLMPIGQKKEPVAYAKDVLRSKNRQCAGVTAKSHGLYLVDVKYPVDYALPDAALRLACFPWYN